MFVFLLLFIGVIDIVYTFSSCNDPRTKRKISTVEREISVFNSYLYLGSLVSSVVTSVLNAQIIGNTAEVAVQSSMLLETVKHADPEPHLRVIVTEIAREDPDVVRLGGMEVYMEMTASKQEVVFDLLEILREELCANHLRYRVAAVDVTVEAKLPLMSGANLLIKDRKVLLVRDNVEIDPALEKRFADTALPWDHAGVAGNLTFVL